MTSILHVLRTAAASGALLLYATSAGPQSVVTAQDHNHEHKAPGEERAQAVLTTPERIAALDRRIRMLAADMRMFSGEMKVEAMASLISAMIERQALVEGEMTQMREKMRQRATGRTEAPVAADEAEPGGMCAAN